MAQTWTKGPLKQVYPQGANLTFASWYGPEGASQTFIAQDLVTNTSGYLVIATSTAAVAIWGIVLEAGHNTTAGAYNVRFAPVFPGQCFFANFLGSTAGDEVLAATDLGTAYEIERSTTLVGGATPGWYINGDVTTTPAAKVVSFWGDTVGMPQASPEAQEARVGDTNARVMGAWLAAQVQMTV